LQPQPSPLLKATVEEIKNKYFSDGQSINNNTTLNKIKIKLLDLLEINIPESKPKKNRPKNKQYLPPKPNKKRLTRAKAKQVK
jgi:hypothetical protein